MSLEIYLIRHGESETNQLQDKFDVSNKLVWGRSTWSELTPKGIAESRALGKYFKEANITFDKLVSSTAIRAQQTARYCLAEMIGQQNLYEVLAKLEVAEDLAEHCQGEWEGKRRTTTGYSKLTQELRSDFPTFFNFSAPGGESPKEVGKRSKNYIDNHILNKGYERVALFTHRGVFAWLLPELFHIDPQESFGMNIRNASVFKLNYHNGEWAGFDAEIFLPGIEDQYLK